MQEDARPVATDRAEREKTMMAVLRLVVAYGLPVSYDEHVKVEVTNDLLVRTGADWTSLC